MTDRPRVIGRIAIGCCLLITACTGPQDGDDGTGGGTGGSGGAASGAGGTATGTGGTTAGSGGATSGTGGAQNGTGGRSGTGGATSGTGGAPAGTGGAAAGTGGRSGTGGVPAGTGGRSGTGGATSGTGGAPAGTGGAGGAMPSSGCGQAPPASARYSIDVGGTMREYILALPTNYDQNRPYRLVFAWHPLGGSAQQVAGTGNSGYYGLRGASAGGAILVSPEGLAFQGSSLGWANTNGRDIAFLRAMIDRFKTELCIDESRIFSTGFSFGGMMSYAVGCAGLARAIAPMAGNSQVSGCTNGTQPVAMMGFHGDDDTVVAISGGRTARDIFVQRNQCSQQTTPVQPSWCDGLSQTNQPCSCVSYQGCAAGYPAIWCEFNGPHTPAPSSAATIWTFFSQF